MNREDNNPNISKFLIGQKRAVVASLIGHDNILHLSFTALYTIVRIPADTRGKCPYRGCLSKLVPPPPAFKIIS